MELFSCGCLLPLVNTHRKSGMKESFVPESYDQILV